MAREIFKRFPLFQERASQAGSFLRRGGRDRLDEFAGLTGRMTTPQRQAAAQLAGFFANASPLQRLGFGLLSQVLGGTFAGDVLRAIEGGMTPRRVADPEPKRKDWRSIAPPTRRPGNGFGGRKPPKIGGGFDDSGDGEIPFGEAVPQPPRRSGDDGVWTHYPGFNRLPPPTPSERADRKKRDVSSVFGTVEMFQPLAPSSNVHEVGYDEGNRTLFIRFQPTELVNGKAKKRRARSGVNGGSTGPIYAYYNCPKRIFDAILNANSPGRTVWDLVRVRGSKWQSQYSYSLAREGYSWDASGNVSPYVARRETQHGLTGREYLGADGRSIMQSTLPVTPSRGEPYRGERG
jgi:hypothetical protein